MAWATVHITDCRVSWEEYTSHHPTGLTRHLIAYRLKLLSEGPVALDVSRRIDLSSDCATPAPEDPSTWT